mgnify:CR=1 FL=1
MSEKEVTVFKIEDSEISDIIKKANVKSKVEEEKIKRAYLVLLHMKKN